MCAALVALCVVLRANQIGSAVIAEGNSAPLTTGAITSTAGSMIIAAGVCYRGDSIACTRTISSSLTGTYTEAGVVSATNVGDRVQYGLVYNVGGQRTSGHTISVASAPTTTNSKSASLQEFDSIAAVPTVTAGTTSTQSLTTAPTCSVTVPSGTATVLGTMVYFGGSTTATMAPGGGTEISEADEDSTHQAMFVGGKFGASGATSITWTLVAARNTSARCYAFEETGGGGGTPGCKNGLLMLGVGCDEATR